MRIYDYIIIGSGFTGQLIATLLSQKTKNILLLEGEPHLGGASRPAQIKNETTTAGLRYFPAHDLALNALRAIEQSLNISLVKEVKENQILTYEASGFKSFVGFGDNPPPFYKELSYFLNPQELELNVTLFEFMQILRDHFKGETLTRSHVTRFNFCAEINEKNNSVQSVTVNGSKEIFAKEFIYAAQVRDLATILQDEILSPRAKAKLKKDHYWMTVCLDFLCTVSNDQLQNLYLLDGTTDDSIGPCIGRFNPIKPDTSIGADEEKVNTATPQISQWVSFIDLNSSEETENIHEVLKKMKRQIKRAFPEIAESQIAERIFVSPPLTAGEIKTTASGQLAKTQNLWLASASLNDQPNLLGSLLQSQLILAALPQIEMTEPAVQFETRTEEIQAIAENMITEESRIPSESTTES